MLEQWPTNQNAHASKCVSEFDVQTSGDYEFVTCEVLPGHYPDQDIWLQHQFVAINVDKNNEMVHFPGCQVFPIVDWNGQKQESRACVLSCLHTQINQTQVCAAREIRDIVCLGTRQIHTANRGAHARTCTGKHDFLTWEVVLPSSLHIPYQAFLGIKCI